MDEMLKVISKYPNGTPLVIELQDGGIISGEIDTIYETNNELDPNDKAYQEFYACLLMIVDIINHSKQTGPYSIGDLIEISIQNPPLEILLNDGKSILEKV